MNERVTSEPSSLCGCNRPLRQSIDSCARCGRDLGSTRYALSPQAQAIAELIADRIAELLESRRSRQKPGKYAATAEAVEVSVRTENSAVEEADQLTLDEEEA